MKTTLTKNLTHIWGAASRNGTRKTHWERGKANALTLVPTSLQGQTKLKFRDLEPEFKPAGHNDGRRLGSHHSDNLASNFTMRLFVVRGEKRSYEWETLRNLSAPTELMRDQWIAGLRVK